MWDQVKFYIVWELLIFYTLPTLQALSITSLFIQQNSLLIGRFWVFEHPINTGGDILMQLTCTKRKTSKLFQMFPTLSDPKISTWLTNLFCKKCLYVGQDEIIWRKKIYSLENFYTTKKKEKKKSHLRAGVELYGHFSSQNSKHRWLESCACDNSRLLSINNTCHFCFTEAVTYCSKWLSMQGPACCPRVHFSSIPNLKGPSSIQPATIATRPWLWVRQPRRSSPPAAHKPEVRARLSARYVLGMGCPAALILGLQGVKREAGLSDGYGVPSCLFYECPATLERCSWCCEWRKWITRYNYRITRITSIFFCGIYLSVAHALSALNTLLPRWICKCVSSSYFCADYKYDVHDEFVRVPETYSLSWKKKCEIILWG